MSDRAQGLDDADRDLIIGIVERGEQGLYQPGACFHGQQFGQFGKRQGSIFAYSGVRFIFKRA